MLNDLLQLSQANRFMDLERLDKKVMVEGDFEGSVTGYWVKLGERGEGVVTYNNKRYVTKPIGFVSIPTGAEVELSFANGIYYSKF